jgi:hypothetical protein
MQSKNNLRRNRHAPSESVFSKLWGKSGELWNPYSRLPDFSFAGYHAGSVPVPDVPVTASVRDFGAKGDGESDDSESFLQAIAEVRRGAILIPAGRYKITRVLRIKKSHLVLRGEGPEKTILFFPRPLADIAPPSGIPNVKQGEWSFWSWSGGVIWVEGDDKTQDVAGDREQNAAFKLADVTMPAKRGDYELCLSDVGSIEAGQMVRLVQYDDAGQSLTRWLYGGIFNDDKGILEYTHGVLINWAVKVKELKGKRVILERPLRVDVKPDWRPEVLAFKPSIEEVGVENLAIEFPNVPYPGHWKEPGYNGIHLGACSNSWIRNVVISDADSGIYLYHYTRHCTVENVRFINKWRVCRIPGCHTGHHGIEANGQDCLVRRFNFETTFFHDITLDKLSNGNVFSEGSGWDINFDHHQMAPHENLFTEIDTGWSTRLWKSGGTHRAGVRETFWNIRTKFPVSYWPQLNLVGVGPARQAHIKDFEEDTLNAISPGYCRDDWIEPANPALMTPRNLYQAQLEYRLNKKKKCLEESPND